MLIIAIHNDGTGTDESANYNVDVLVNTTPIDRLRVEGHNRQQHWTKLVQRVVDEGTKTQGGR